MKSCVFIKTIILKERELQLQSSLFYAWSVLSTNNFTSGFSFLLPFLHAARDFLSPFDAKTLRGSRHE